MTEIPEHLLKRSKERRAAIGGEESPAGDAAPASAAVEATAETPAAASPAVPAPAPVEPVAPAPAPVRPEVAAALRRRKIPYWAMPVLAGLPLWAYVYQATLEPPPASDAGPIALGAEVYNGCASCHGASGGGGVGPALTDVLATFPDYRDHMMWVKLGSSGWPADTYGANDTPKAGGMPSHTALSDAELAQVTLYERATFGGLEEGSEEYVALEEVAEGTTTFSDVGLGPESEADGVSPAELEQG